MTGREMDVHAAMATLHGARREGEIVITTMGAAREWVALGPGPADLVYVPSSMGQITALALGVALARPDRRVIACNGDGSMLMNLGSLVTITAEAPENLVVVVLVNGLYEVTGGQPTPGFAGVRGGGTVDFAAIARGCGFQAAYHFDDEEEWRARVREVLDARGPTFVSLQVAPIPNPPGAKSPGPTSERVERFMAALRDDR